MNIGQVGGLGVLGCHAVDLAALKRQAAVVVAQRRQ